MPISRSNMEMQLLRAPSTFKSTKKKPAKKKATKKK